ncbi:MAG TPA: hypothetical protein VD997_06680 [Phycisphaerales bacterium]|nr:hypothetical protein [Phycisphaerales bacterium]
MRMYGILAVVAAGLASAAWAQEKKDAAPVKTQPAGDAPKEAPKQEVQPEYRPEAVDWLRKEAGTVMPLIANMDVRKIAFSTTWLPVIDERVIYVDKRWTKAFTPEQFEKLSEEEKKTLHPEKFDGYRFYFTRYGSPLAYLRPLDLVADAIGGPMPLRGKKILDYGYGTIGHLRLMASQNMDVTGVEVDPSLKALYSREEDTGKVPGVGMDDIPPPGSLTLVHGKWPGDKDVAEKVGGGYDIITSKNTLKNGYINPEQKVPKEMLVDLSVPPEEFVAKVHAALKPGGVFMIYNISPKQTPPGEGYKPWSDGRCPFPREMLEKAGFEVLEYNKDDSATIRRFGAALEWDKKMDLENDCFAVYTLVRRKAEEPPTPK